MTNYSDLGDLANPARFHDALDIAGEDTRELRRQLETMLTIRMAEQHLARKRQEGVIGGPVHLGVGQEATAVGISRHLRATDVVFGGHRSHPHLLALGSSLHGLFAEVLGKATGLSKGMGGSMHLWDGPRGFFGSVPIVGGTVALAVGTALAAKLKGTSDVSVSYFGDGAVEEGVVHESLNLASVLKVPIIFVVENNFFSSHMEVSLRQTSNVMARFAEAHGMPNDTVDGNDVVHVARVARSMIERARQGGGPSFLEAVTYRWYGHVDWREDIDVGVNRSMEHLANWRRRDPISRLRLAMEIAGVLTTAEYDEMSRSIASSIALAWDNALRDPWPEPEDLVEAVYSSPALQA